jgi:hypothetical protein
MRSIGAAVVTPHGEPGHFGMSGSALFGRAFALVMRQRLAMQFIGDAHSGHPWRNLGLSGAPGPAILGRAFANARASGSQAHSLTQSRW